MSQVSDLQVGQPAPHRLGLDEGALRMRVRHAGDAAARVALGHPQAQRAPAATEFEHLLAIGEFGAFAGGLQRGGFGGVEVGHAFGPPAAAVLQVPTEHRGEERRRQLVVLVVGLVGEQRQRRFATATRRTPRSARRRARCRRHRSRPGAGAAAGGCRRAPPHRAPCPFRSIRGPDSTPPPRLPLHGAPCPSALVRTPSRIGSPRGGVIQSAPRCVERR